MRIVGFLGIGVAFCVPALADEVGAPTPPASALIAADCPALALAPDAIKAMVEAEAARQKVDVKLALAIARQESRFGLDLNSLAGAHGIMQLMPATAARYQVRDLCDPSENIRGGIAYIKDLTALYRGNVLLVLAGYNAGETRVKAAGGVPPLAETVRYVAAGVNEYYGLAKVVAGEAAPDPQPPTASGAASTDAAGQRWIGGSVLYVTQEALP